MKSVLALALVALMTLVLATGARVADAAVTTDSLAEVRARGELRLAADIQGGEPYVYEDETTPGKLVGFEVEIADGVARRLGVRAKFMQADWSNLVPSLERSDFDVIMNGLEATPDRRERILLSRAYFVYQEILAVPKTSTASSLDDLRGKRIGTLNQSYAFLLLRDRPLETVLYEGVQEPYADLESGRLDGVLLESVIANRYGCSLAKVRCIEREIARGTYVVGLRKGDVALKGAIDDAIGAMIADGELRAILERWKLWSSLQSDLGAASTPDTTLPHDAPAAPRSLDRAQIVLFLEGALITLGLTCGAFAIAMPLGLLLAIARLYGGTIGRVLSATYVEVFRGTPVLLQLYILYFGLAPFVRLGPIAAAILGLGLNYAAYEAEVHRGALLAVPRGQGEAASALGLTRAQTLRHVLLPQSFRHALPAVTNDFVALLKDSSLVSVITVVELTKRMTIAAVEVRGWLVPGLVCAALYFAMSFPLARLSRRLEKRLHRDPNPRPL